MAAKRGRPRKSKASTATAITKNKKEMTESRRQMTSVMLFAVSVFLLCVVFIKGQKVWLWMHNVLFGIFGFCAYILPFLLGWVAVMFALNKLSGSIRNKIIEAYVFVGLICAAVDIFSTAADTDVKFFEHLANAFSAAFAGTVNGGFIGSLVGHSLFSLFGKMGAVITIILLLFVFFMLITGTTLIGFFKTVAKPVQELEKHAEEAYNRHAEEKEIIKAEKEKVKPRNAFDVPEPSPEPEVQEEQKSIEERSKKVLETYHDSPVNIDIEAPKEEKEEPKQEVKIPKEFEDISSSSVDAVKEDAYRYPPVTLLKDNENAGGQATQADLDATAQLLVDTLKSFGVETRIVDISRGPVVTRYELQPSAGVKINRITNLVDDITLNLATAGVRIEAPIPNKAAVGIEVPNKKSALVTVREIIESPAFVNSKSKLTAALGRDIGGNAVVCDIADMPHGLIAGATNSGKSVCINSIIISILYKASPEEVKLILIDPKVVELGIYNGIPHLLVPVVTDPRKASGALAWAVLEMERRYKLFADNNVRDLKGYNELADMSEDMPRMSQIVIIIDELADLMMTAAKEVEESICRIAQKARAAGMHLIIATQRPSVDVVTGLIKANIPTRVAFAVSSQIDSRTILDVGGAEKLLGKGDMLYSPLGASKASRVQGCFVSSKEITAVVDYVKSHHDNNYDEAVMDEIEKQAEESNKKGSKGGGGFDADDDDGVDVMLDQAIEVVVDAGQASTSLLQRRLKLGYARAARIIDQMEQRGIVGPYEGSKPRKVLISKSQLMEKQAAEE